MKVFQLTLRSCATLGFGPYQSTTRKYPINRKNVRAIAIFFFPLTFSCAYFFLEASTFEEYATSVEQYVTLLLGMVIFLIFIWKHQQICGLHKNFERTIDERELDFTTLTSIFTSIKHTTFDFRIKTSSISGQLHGNQFTSGRMDENYPFCLFASCFSHLCNSKSHFQLLPVLCQGFGMRCVWTTISVTFFW